MAHHITKNNPKGRPGRISLFRLDLAPWKYSVMCIGTSKFDVIEYVFHSANPPVHYMTKNGRKSGSGGLFLVLLDLALWKSSKMYIATNKIHLIRYIFDRFTIRSNIGPRCPDRFGWIGYLWSWLTQLHENQTYVCMYVGTRKIDLRGYVFDRPYSPAHHRTKSGLKGKMSGEDLSVPFGPSSIKKVEHNVYWKERAKSIWKGIFSIGQPSGPP